MQVTQVLVCQLLTSTACEALWMHCIYVVQASFIVFIVFNTVFWALRSWPVYKSARRASPASWDIQQSTTPTVLQVWVEGTIWARQRLCPENG